MANKIGYVYKDTLESYNGRTISIGGKHFSTKTGAMEGTSREVEQKIVKSKIVDKVSRIRGGGRSIRQISETGHGINSRTRQGQSNAKMYRKNTKIMTKRMRGF